MQFTKGSRERLVDRWVRDGDDEAVMQAIEADRWDKIICKDVQLDEGQGRLVYTRKRGLVVLVALIIDVQEREWADIVSVFHLANDDPEDPAVWGP